MVKGMDHDTTDPTSQQIEQDTGWYAWQGVNELWYASRPRTTPPVILRDENTTELLAQIVAWERQH